MTVDNSHPTTHTQTGLAIAVTAVVQGFSLAVTSGITPLLAKSFGVEVSEAAEMLRARWWLALLVILLVAPADKGSRKAAAIIMTIGAALAAFWASFSSSLLALAWFVEISRALGSAAAIVLLVLAIEAFAPERSGLGASLVVVGGAVGASLVSGLRPFFDEATGWTELMRFSGFGAIAVALASLALTVDVEAATSNKALWRPLASPLAARFWPLSGALFLVAVFTSGYLTPLQEHLVRPGLWDTEQLIGALTFSGVAGVFASLLAGRFSDATGRQAIASSALLLAGLGSVVAYFSSTSLATTVGLIATSIGLFGFATANGAHRVELFPKELRASALGWLSLVVVLGALLGQTLVAKELFDPRTLLAILAGSLIIAVGALNALPETRTTKVTTVDSSS